MESLKIIIVEDDKMLSTVSAMFLSSLGHELVAKLQCGHQAIEFCRISPPDLIIMDVHLDEGSDGIETARKIGEFAQIPVIFLSSDSDEATIRRSIMSHAYGFLRKPVNKNTLGLSIEFAYLKSQFDASVKK